jgi:hypothetical protein
VAKLGADQIRVYFAGFDIGTSTTSVGVTLAVEPLDPTSLGDVAERTIPGQRNDVVEWAGLFDDSLSADAAGSAMLGSAGTNNVFSVHFGTGTGKVAFAGTAIMFAAKAGGGVKDFVYQEETWQPDGTLEKGFTQCVKTMIIGSGSSTFLDFGGSSLNGARLYLQVFSYAGGGSATITVEHGSATSAVVTLGTFIVSTRNSFVGSFAGTIRRFTRITKDATGSAEVAVVLVRS